MDFGISWVPNDLRDFGELVRRTEEIGVRAIGVPDSQAARYRECFVTLTHLFDNTERVHAGPLVTNPVTRHPAVMAAALASADEISGQRAFVCIGVGDSGVLNLGLRPAKLAALEAYVLALRELLTTGRTTYQGQVCTVGCTERPLPILIAANGPRTLRLAGRIADGVLIGSGLDASAKVLAAHVVEGAASAGRGPDEIEVWHMARGALAEDRDDALALALPSLAGSANHIFRSTMEGKDVPEHVRTPLRQLQERINPAFKSIPGADNPNAQLVAELGLTEFLADRLGIIGTEADAIDRLRHLREAGIDKIMLRPLVVDRHEFLDRFERVIERVNADVYD